MTASSTTIETRVIIIQITLYLIRISILGVPCAPRISYINNSICFSADSNFQYPVDYYDVNVTDVTGLQTSLTGTYNNSQCLPIISESYPNVCRPFQVTATATNAHGTSNVTTYNSTTNNRPEGTVVTRANLVNIIIYN